MPDKVKWLVVKCGIGVHKSTNESVYNFIQWLKTYVWAKSSIFLNVTEYKACTMIFLSPLSAWEWMAYRIRIQYVLCFSLDQIITWQYHQSSCLKIHLKLLDVILPMYILFHQVSGRCTDGENVLYDSPCHDKASDFMKILGIAAWLFYAS